MAKTDKGYLNQSPDDLIDRVGKDITFASYTRKGETLTFGLSGKRCYFRIKGPQWIMPRFAMAATNQRARDAFCIFRSKGFNRELKDLYRWHDRRIVFDYEKNSPNSYASQKRKTIEKKRKAGGKRVTPIKRRPLKKSDAQDLAKLSPEGSGTCFCISKDTLFLTNYHVVRNAKRILIDSERFLSIAHVVFASEEDDLALLKSERKSGFSPLSIATLSPEIADYVFTVGYPDPSIQGRNIKFSEGTISALSGFRDCSSQFQISVPLQPGNSGGALVNEKGEVVGVVQSTLNPFFTMTVQGGFPQGVNYAVSHSALNAFFRSNNVPCDEETRVTESTNLQRKEIVNSAINATCKVEIFTQRVIDTQAKCVSKYSKNKGVWRQVWDFLKSI